MAAPGAHVWAPLFDSEKMKKRGGEGKEGRKEEGEKKRKESSHDATTRPTQIPDTFGTADIAT